MRYTCSADVVTAVSTEAMPLLGSLRRTCMKDDTHLPMHPCLASMLAERGEPAVSCAHRVASPAAVGYLWHCGLLLRRLRGGRTLAKAAVGGQDGAAATRSSAGSTPTLFSKASAGVRRACRANATWTATHGRAVGEASGRASRTATTAS